MPQGAEGSLSLSGIPPEALTAMADIADDRGITLRDAYTEAARSFLEAVRRGEKYSYLSTQVGSSRKTIWIDPDVAAELDELRKELNRSRSSVMITAIKHYLLANGRSVDL